MHEKTHVEIYRHYGLESKVDYFNKDFIVTTRAEGNCPNEFCIAAQNNADNIGYHSQITFLLIGILGLFIVLILEEINAKL